MAHGQWEVERVWICCKAVWIVQSSGHEYMDTTQVYSHANMQLKEQALAKTDPFTGPSRRFRPSDQLLTFLQSL